MELHQTLLAMPVVSWLWIFVLCFGLVFLYLNIIDAVLFNFTGRDLVAKSTTAIVGVLIAYYLRPVGSDAWWAIRALPAVWFANLAYFTQVRQLSLATAKRSDGKVVVYQDGTVEKLPHPSYGSSSAA